MPHKSPPADRVVWVEPGESGNRRETLVSVTLDASFTVNPSAGQAPGETAGLSTSFRFTASRLRSSRLPAADGVNDLHPVA